jgi:poly(A) polymerase
MRSLWQRLWQPLRQRIFPVKMSDPAQAHIPCIIPRSTHSLSRKSIPEHVLKVLYRLHKNGFSAYLVGGGVRDLLLERSPKDFDVATNAKPEQVRHLFRNSRIIGRRFKLVHVSFGRELVEVATFRAQHELNDELHAKTSETGLLLRDNVYGNLEQDAFRRDFTINALYYNIADFSLLDYTCGLSDLKDRVLRMIGDPEKRYREDPVRMLRAIRFASKLDLEICADTAAPIPSMACLLHEVSNARLFDEMLKLFHSGAAERAFSLLIHYGLIAVLFPSLEASIVRESSNDLEIAKKLLLSVCHNTDLRIKEEKPTSATFLFASFLWSPMIYRCHELVAAGERELVAFEKAADLVLRSQVQIIGIPKRLQHSIRDIWRLQFRLDRQLKRAMRLVEEPLFRAGYDFYLLRASVEDALVEKATWWKNFVEAEVNERERLLTALAKTTKPASRKKNYKPRRRKKITPEFGADSGSQT